MLGSPVRGWVCKPVAIRWAALSADVGESVGLVHVAAVAAVAIVNVVAEAAAPYTEFAAPARTTLERLTHWLPLAVTADGAGRPGFPGAGPPIVPPLPPTGLIGL